MEVGMGDDLDKEYNAIVTVIDRRSQSQERFLLFNLTSSGVIFSVILDGIVKDNTILLIIPFISFILYLLWIDHAITIAALEKYIKEKNGLKNGWYYYREQLNKQKIMKLKKHLYNLSVSLGFTGPSISAMAMYLWNRLDEIAITLLIIDLTLIVIQILFLIIWRRYSKDLYG
jgi:hypothetical protein